MKNDFEAPEVFVISRIGDFVLGRKPWAPWEIDAVFGWGYGFFPWDDLDEEEL